MTDVKVKNDGSDRNSPFELRVFKNDRWYFVVIDWRPITSRLCWQIRARVWQYTIHFDAQSLSSIVLFTTTLSYSSTDDYDQHDSCIGVKRLLTIYNKMLAKASAHVRESWFWNPWNFCLWNMESWALECGIQLNESGILLRIGIQSKVPLENTGIKCLESGINGVESRIQDCLGFPYMRRKAAHVKYCCLRIY